MCCKNASSRSILICLATLGVSMSQSASRAAAPGPKPSNIPNVSMRTHEGKTVRFHEDLIKGKIVLVNFMYTNCEGICPGQTANLVQVQDALGDRLGRDVFIYSITLDPERDTPEVLKKYARIYRTKPGWSFLTGAPKDVELLRRRLGFVDPDPELDKKRSQHLGVVLIGNEPLSRWSACPALSEPSVLLELVGWMQDPQKPSASELGKASKAPPVCPISRGRGSIPVTYEGQTYQVCCTGCKEKFEANPRAVLADFTRKPPDSSPKTPPGGAPAPRSPELQR